MNDIRSVFNLVIQSSITTQQESKKAFLIGLWFNTDFSSFEIYVHWSIFFPKEAWLIITKHNAHLSNPLSCFTNFLFFQNRTSNYSLCNTLRISALFLKFLNSSFWILSSNHLGAPWFFQKLFRNHIRSQTFFINQN